MPKPSLTFVIAALALVVSACAGEDGTGASTTVTSLDATATTMTGTDTTTPATIAEPTTTPAPTARPTTVTLTEQPVLRGDGLGPANIGDAENEAITALTHVFGQPTSDIAREGPFPQGLRCSTALGIPCFNYVRVVEWHTFGVTVIISDWVLSPDTESFDPVESPPNLRGFRYTGGASVPTLQTAEGITIGSTLDDLRVAYGDDLHISEDPCTFDTEYGFTLLPGPTITAGLWGQLSRQPAGDVVEAIGAGASAGC